VKDGRRKWRLDLYLFIPHHSGIYLSLEYFLAFFLIHNEFASNNLSWTYLINLMYLEIILFALCIFLSCGYFVLYYSKMFLCKDSFMLFLLVWRVLNYLYLYYYQPNNLQSQAKNAHKTPEDMLHYSLSYSYTLNMVIEFFWSLDVSYMNTNIFAKQPISKIKIKKTISFCVDKI